MSRNPERTVSELADKAVLSQGSGLACLGFPCLFLHTGKMAVPSPIIISLLDNMQKRERRGRAFTSCLTLYQSGKSFIEAHIILSSGPIGQL